jgi:hypothetical protein
MVTKRCLLPFSEVRLYLIPKLAAATVEGALHAELLRRFSVKLWGGLVLRDERLPKVMPLRG